MTASAPPAPVQLWSAMPGWGIAADLTPPEVTNARELRTLHKLLVAGLIALLLVCVGGYVLAKHKESAASSALDSVQAQTNTLQASERKYVGVTQIQGDVTQIEAQIATLMGGDVDLVAYLGRFRSALPVTMAIESEAVSVTPTTTSTSTSGASVIAAVVISGTGHALSNLAAYVDALMKIKGVADVNPTTNVAAAGVAHFSVSLSLTTAAFSHRFDVGKTRTK